MVSNIVSNIADPEIVFANLLVILLISNIVGNIADSAILLAILPAISNQVLYVPGCTYYYNKQTNNI